jgi:hypothetical protein
MREDWKAGQRVEGNPNFSKSNPNPRQIRASSSKARPNQSQENPWISFAESSLFNNLRRPPGPFFLFAPLPALKKATDGVAAARFAPGFSVVSWVFISSSSLPSSSEVKGWRLFLVADARARGFARPVGRGA